MPTPSGEQLHRIGDQRMLHFTSQEEHLVDSDGHASSDSDRSLGDGGVLDRADRRAGYGRLAKATVAAALAAGAVVVLCASGAITSPLADVSKKIGLQEVINPPAAGVADAAPLAGAAVDVPEAPETTIPETTVTTAAGDDVSDEDLDEPVVPELPAGQVGNVESMPPLESMPPVIPETDLCMTAKFYASPINLKITGVDCSELLQDTTILDQFNKKAVDATMQSGLFAEISSAVSIVSCKDPSGAVEAPETKDVFLSVHMEVPCESFDCEAASTAAPAFVEALIATLAPLVENADAVTAAEVGAVPFGDQSCFAFAPVDAGAETDPVSTSSFDDRRLMADEFGPDRRLTGASPGASPGSPGASPGSPGASPGSPGASPGSPGASPGSPGGDVSTSGTVPLDRESCNCGSGECDVDGTCQCPYGTEGEFCEIVGEVLLWSEEPPAQRAEEYMAAITVAGRRLAPETTPVPAEGAGAAAEPSDQESFACPVTDTINDVVTLVTDDASGDVECLLLGFVSSEVKQPWVAVSSEWTEQGEGFECAGVAQVTTEVEAQVDDVLVYFYKTVDGGEELRPLTVLLKDGELYDKVIYESHAALTPMSDFQKVEYTFQEAGSYQVVFHLGSKDSTAGGAIGGMAYFKPAYVRRVG